MNALQEAYEMGKLAGLTRRLLHSAHAPLHFGAHQAAHKKVHHAIVPGGDHHEEHRKTAAGAGAAGLLTAPIWMPAAMGTRAMREGDYGRGGALLGAPVGLLGGMIGGALGRSGSGKRALIGAGLGALGGSGLGYLVGKPFED